MFIIYNEQAMSINKAVTVFVFCIGLVARPEGKQENARKKHQIRTALSLLKYWVLYLVHLQMLLG